MSTFTVSLDDEAAHLVREAARAVNQPLDRWLSESLRQAAARTLRRTKAGTARIFPLHPGAMEAAPDFNAPLPEFSPYL